MTRAARFRAYAPPAIIFICAVILIITQALGVPATLAERITWLAVTAATAAAYAFQASAARTYRRLYRSVSESYDKCAASRDYWMLAAREGTNPTPDGDPGDGQLMVCGRCGRSSVPATGACLHDTCAWCAWCQACAGPWAPVPRSGMIP